MRPRRRCCRGFCAALSIQHPLFLSLLSTISLPLSISFSVRSSSLPSYLALSTFLTPSFSLLPFFSFHLYSFISSSLSLCHLFVSIALYSPPPLSHVSLLLSTFVSVALVIPLSSKRFRKSSLPATARSIPRRLVFFENLKSFQ